MFWLFLLFTRASNAQISHCNDESIVGLRICSHQAYDKGIGHTFPQLVDSKIIMHDIPEFNADDKTITIFMTLVAHWNDTRIKVESSDQ